MPSYATPTNSCKLERSLSRARMGLGDFIGDGAGDDAPDEDEDDKDEDATSGEEEAGDER